MESEDKTLSGQTTSALREAIVKGIIPPGEKLNEPKLAEQFEVSRGPLREAIRRLVSMRLSRAACRSNSCDFGSAGHYGAL